MYTHVLLICVLLLLPAVNLSCSNFDISQHLGTKTAYRIIENRNVDPLIYPGCEPLKIWMVIRHGTRLPSKGFIEYSKERLPILRDEIIKNSLNSTVKLNQNELKRLKNWKIDVEYDNEAFLAHEGEDEMVNLAERMQLRLPTIFSNIYSNTSYKFKFTATQRTEESAKYFARGLFGRQTAKAVWYPKPLDPDPVLRFYKLCDKWRREVKKNPAAILERTLFIQGKVFQSTSKVISEKLGFNYTLSSDDIYNMYMACAYESAWFKTELSPWCAVFNEETIKVLEYSEDLKYYYIDGYGYKLTHDQACPAVKNMVEFFKRPDDNPKAVLYFTHSGTILKLLAHFGLYRDHTPLKHDNEMEHETRHWRVSKIDAFGSNIAVVLFRCGDTNKVLFLHQERPVKLPLCSSELCDFDKFLHAFHDSVNNCKFEEMCRI